jgi:SGNH hydrolase-like domain, acetyltransferase AlgX
LVCSRSLSWRLRNTTRLFISFFNTVDRREELPIGHDAPSTPKHSLPSYREPTPETRRKVSREEEAEIALKNTFFTSASRELLTAIFLATIVAFPAIQFTSEFRAVHSLRRLPTLTAFSSLCSRFHLEERRSPADFWRVIPRAADTKAVEKTLENESIVSQWLLPRVQTVLAENLGAGSEQVYLGRQGWLFYRADVDYVTGPGFLRPLWIKHRIRTANVQPEAVKAIARFRHQLARRGIDLIVVPVPVKPSIDGEMLASYPDDLAILENESFSEFKSQLARANVSLFDPEDVLRERKKQAAHKALYFRRDTHWLPETMETVAQQLAARLSLPPVSDSVQLHASAKAVTAPGDIARMLKLPLERSQTQEVTIHQVTAGNNLWRPSRDADVLLLGDSFSNIFSLEALGWGESAGFAEHLSQALHGRPLDCILRNSDGAFATREALRHELARGRDRLAGKKLVIWQFAARELAFGNWKSLDMTLQAPRPASLFTPKHGEQPIATGTVKTIGPVPRPGTVPYTDHIVAVHLVDVTVPGQPSDTPLQSLVYLWSMRDNIWTAAARLRPGDQVKIRLRPWEEVSEQYEKINRSDIPDTALSMEEPAWGELVN